MNKAALGAKRKCLECGTNFFDLLRDPIVCPRCKTTFVPPAPPPPAVVYKRKGPLTFAPVPAAAAAENDSGAEGQDEADLRGEDDEGAIESDDEPDELDEEPDDDTLPLNNA